MEKQINTTLAFFLAMTIQLVSADLYVSVDDTTEGLCTSETEPCAFQTALDIAQTNAENNVIHVAPGIYNISQTLTYQKYESNLSILGAGKSSTILDGGESLQIMYLNGNRNIFIKGVTFSKGYSDGCGGGLFVHSDVVTIEDSSFNDNFSNTSGGGVCTINALGNLILSNNTFIRNTAGFGAGISASFHHGRKTFINNTFIENSAIVGGGIALTSENAAMYLTNNSFIRNSAQEGGGVYINGGDTILTNNIFIRNSAQEGGGAYFSFDDEASKDIALTNNTFSYNTSNKYGGGIYIFIWSPTKVPVQLYNNIIWGNTADNGGYDGDDLYVYEYFDFHTNLNLYNNNLGINTNFNSGQSEDLYLPNTGNYIQTNNLKVDPQFIDEFHLSDNSPLIDEGNNSAPLLPITDFNGDDRVIDGNYDGIAIPDIGADEYQPAKTPEEQADDIIQFIDSGVLIGTGKGLSADKKINALRNMIRAAKQLILNGELAEACDKLESTYQLTDGDSIPADFVSGDASSKLAYMIQNLMDSLGCS